MSEANKDPLLEAEQAAKPPLDVQEETLDAAQQSVADALKVCFFLLKMVMVVLIILYLGSGIFSVPPQHEAVRLRFGKIVGEPGEQVIKTGTLQFALPFPIEQVVRVYTAPQRLEITEDFWYSLTPQQRIMKPDELVAQKSGPLSPETEGSIISGDANIIHAQFSLSYRVNDTIKYITNVGDPSLPGRANMGRQIVADATRSAVIQVLGSHTADQIISGNIDREGIVRLTQKTLDALGAGIVVEPEQFSLVQQSMPLSVRDAFQSVINADNERAQKVEQARREANKILAETAGEGYDQLWKMIQAYDVARVAGNSEQIQKTEAALMQALSDQRTPVEFGAVRITGDASRVINDAVNYRTTATTAVQTEVRRFNTFYEQYAGKPELRNIMLSRLWLDAKQEILRGDVETFYVPAGRTYLDLNPDPGIQLKRERDMQMAAQSERVRAAEEAAAKAKAASNRPEGANP